MRRFTILSVALASVVGLLVGLILAGEFTPAPVVTSAPRAYPVMADSPPVLPAGGAGANFADVVERINAAVVNIDATSNRSGIRDSQRFFRRGPDDNPREFDGPSRGAGSGFIIDSDGFILTNHHVIEHAERITVTLSDGRAFRGQVVGTDPAIDVALLKITGARGLTEAPLGNSDQLRVGEWVCAIGNPLGYVHSVTVGVVSFIGRTLFDPSLDDYIQTDAAINFGNSGGPLINARGEVIGINSAVSSRTNTIGFAVPINQAVSILPQLKGGKVSRGYLGVMLTDVTPALQRALALGVTRGALVHDFTSDAPAERSGLRVYDVIVDVDGREMASNDDVIRDISARPPGSVVRVQVVRDDKRLTLPVRLAERPNPSRGDSDGLPGRGGAPPVPATPDLPLGLTVRELDRGAALRLNIPTDVQGVLITRVDPTGAAFSAQIRRGLVITEINRKPIRSVADYDRAVAAVRPGDVLALYYLDPNNGQRAFATVTVDL